jgi:hypothetical protein
MTKSRKLLIGFLSLLPIIFLVIYMVTFFSFFITMFRNVQQPDVMPEMIFQKIGLIFGFAMAMMFCSLGLLIYFIIHAVNNKTFDGTERIVWILIFVFAGMVGFPIYWYMRIWKETPAI